MKNNIIGAALALSLLASSYAALANDADTAKAANVNDKKANLKICQVGDKAVVWNGQFKLKFFGEGVRFVANGKTLVRGEKLKVYYANLDGMAHANPNYIDRENIFLVVDEINNTKKVFFNVRNPRVIK